MAADTAGACSMDVTFRRAQEAQLAGRVDEAERLYGEALTLDPDSAQVIHGIGNLLQQRGAFAQAIEHYRRALSLAPDLALAYYNLGYCLEQLGRREEAVCAYRDALARRPDIALAYFRLGSLLHDKEQLDEAAECYQRAIARKPDLARAHYQLGKLRQQQGQLEPSANSFRKAIEIDPDFGAAHLGLAAIRRLQHRIDDTAECLHAALRTMPGDVKIHTMLGNMHTLRQDAEQARTCFAAALRRQPSYAPAKLGYCMSLLPPVYQSETELLERRHAYQQALAELSAYYDAAPASERASAADVVGRLQPFFLSYQGLNDRSLQHCYGELMCQLMSARYPEWSHPRPAASYDGDRRLRVGIVSGFFWAHSNWKVPIRGWAQQIDRSRFELFGYHTSAMTDRNTADAAECFATFVQGPKSLPQWCELIAGHRLDALIFPEIGMDTPTMRLGCMRLAPVQIVSWGHPVTSGLPTMDYYLSSTLMEPADGQAHYTERLITLPNLSIYYPPSQTKRVQRTREDFGVARNEIFFWCCQSLMKYLPQNDDVFVRIAQQLPRAKFVFIDLNPVFSQIFRRRMNRVFDAAGLDFEKRSVFLPKLYVEEFAAAAAHANVFLDSIGWSGCNSTLESLAQNCPVVTLAGDLMRGRHSAAILQRMELSELIPRDKDAYVELAVRLGRDRAYRRSLRECISRQKALLYNDLEPIRALEEFLLRTAQDASP
jgi:protein O-GlcNAc transferase